MRRAAYCTCLAAIAAVMAAGLSAAPRAAQGPSDQPGTAADPMAGCPMLRAPRGGFYPPADPWEELRMMQDRLNRIFDDSRLLWGPGSGVPGGIEEQVFAPDVDVTETAKELVVTCDIPGMEKDKIEVVFRDGNLIISGTREVVKEEKEPAGWTVRERSTGSFERVVPIGAKVDESKIRADYKNGVLTVVLPLTEPATKPGKKIQIL